MHVPPAAFPPRHARPQARRPLAAAVAFALLLGGSGACAAQPAVATWTGSVSGDWTVAGNWTVPPSGDSYVLINATTPHGSTLDGSAADIGLLAVGDSGWGTLDIVHGGSLTVGGSDANGVGAVFARQFTPVGSRGEVTVSGAGSTLTVTAGTQIGNDGAGVLSVLDGGTANLGLGRAYAETLLGFGGYGWTAQGREGRGVVNVDGAGSTVNYAGGFNVLNGEVNLGHGGRLVSHPRDADGQAGWVDTIGFGVPANPDGSYAGLYGTGEVTIQGTGSAWVSGNELQVGVGGVGRLSILAGGQASFAGAAELGTVSYLYDAPGGSPVPGLAGRMGSGEIVVAGDGSTFTVGAETVIGMAGTGSLEVSDGGTANLGLDTAYSEPMIGFTDGGTGPGAMHGTGTLTVDGGGSTVNYAGGLNVVNGTVTVSGGGQLLHHVRDADGAGAQWIDVIGVGTPGLDGAPGWRGAGAVTVSGAGSAWNSGSQLQMGYGGDATLSILDGGTAKFAGSATLGSIAYSYDPATGIRQDSQQGTAAVRVAGAGSTLSVSAIAGATGAAGAIDVGVDGPGSLAVADGGTVSADGGIRLGALGTLTVGGTAGDGAAVAPGRLDVATIDFAAPAATLTFRHTDALYLFDAVLSGNGHIDATGGFNRLTADSSAFTGTTTVDDGATLSVNGKLGGDILVGAQGTLQGTGTVGNATVAGTLAPGNSPGTLHVAGDLVMQAGSVYAAQIDPATGVSDSVEVAGDVTIEPGTTLEIENLGTQPLAPGARIELIQTTGADSQVSGQFDNTEGALGSFLDYGVSYENGQINVGVTRSQTSFASVGGSAGMAGLGAALDGLPAASPLSLLLFGQITTPEQAAVAFDAMAGSMNADLRRVLLEDSRTTRDAIGRRWQQSGTDGDAGAAWWVQATGHWGSQDGAGDVAEAHANGSGVLVGVDTGVGAATRLGLALGAGQTSYDTTGQDVHATDRQVALYGRSTAGAFGIGYGVAGAWHDIHARRRFAVGSALQSTDSDHDARTDQAFVDVGYRLGGDKAYVEPFAAVAHVVLHSDAATETGSAAALVTRGGSDAATFGTLGARWGVRGDAAQWYGSLGWRHVAGFGRTVATQSFVAGGPAFETLGLPLTRNAAAVELGMRFDLSRRAHVAADYAGLCSHAATDQSAQLTLTFDW